MVKTSSHVTTKPAYKFPERRVFERAVSSLATTLPRWAGEEGPRHRIEFSPGAIRTTSTDLGLKNRSENDRIAAHLRKNADMLEAEIAAAKKKKPGEIKGHSLKSRSRMALRFATIDYSALFVDGRTPAMLTLTMPHDWTTVAPTAGDFKKLVNRFREAYRRSWGEYIAGIWKMEFQWRKQCAADGCHDPAAPHLHIIMSPPPGTALAPPSLDDLDHLAECDGCENPSHTSRYEFTEWVSRAWADAVRHPDPVERRKHERAGTGVDYDELTSYADPKRIGIYFSKHGLYSDKEYQNVLPRLWRENGGGARFWGYWVVRPMIVSKEIHEALIMHIMSSQEDATCYWPDHAIGCLCTPLTGAERRRRTRAASRAASSKESRRATVRDAGVMFSSPRGIIRKYQQTESAVTVMRHMRHLAEKQAYRRPEKRWYTKSYNPVTGEAVRRPRRLHRKHQYLRNQTHGFIAVNDGERAALDVARLLGGSPAAVLVSAA